MASEKTKKLQEKREQLKTQTAPRLLFRSGRRPLTFNKDLKDDPRFIYFKSWKKVRGK